MPKFTVNGKRFDWGDVDLHIPGLNLDIDEISYGDEQKKENVYGLGRKPKGYTKGNYEPNAKMSLSREDFGNLIEYCKKKNIKPYDLQFEKIAVSYANDSNPMMVDTLSKVSIAKLDAKATQNDGVLKIPIDLHVGGVINWNGIDAV